MHKLLPQEKSHLPRRDFGHSSVAPVSTIDVYLVRTASLVRECPARVFWQLETCIQISERLAGFGANIVGYQRSDFVQVWLGVKVWARKRDFKTVGARFGVKFPNHAMRERTLAV